MMTDPRRRFSPRRALLIGLGVLLATAALVWLLRDISLADVVRALQRLTPGEIIVVLLVNLGVTLVFSLRWWLIVRLLGCRASIAEAWAIRLAGFAVSYLTPGTQFGGEPLQVALLQRRRPIATQAATASVVIDRAVELLGNFTFLAFGLVLSLQLRLLPGEAAAPLTVAALTLLLLPLAFLAAAVAGVRPLTALLTRLPSPAAWRLGAWARLLQWTRSTEDVIVGFCREQPAGLAAAMGISLVSWGTVVFEYGLLSAFLGIPLDPIELIGVITAGRVALLVPVPGGLGALEASQVLALTALGYSRAEGLGLGLLIRARDLVFAFAGLALGAISARGRRDAARPDAT
jgi:uncharacterized protein (TIRG00374 family)